MSTVETPISHSESAATFQEQLRAAVSAISGFGFLTSGQRRKLASRASVPDAFLLQVAQALDAAPDIAVAARVQGAELRDAVTFSQAFAPVATAMQVYARGLLETIAARRADAGDRALRAYSMAKSFDRPSQRVLVVPEVRAMKTTLGRGRPSGSTRLAASEPQPLPPAAPPLPALPAPAPVPAAEVATS